MKFGDTITYPARSSPVSCVLWPFVADERDTPVNFAMQKRTRRVLLSSLGRLLQMMDGIRTEVVVIPYADRTFVVVTQLKKLGTLVRLVPHPSGVHITAPTNSLLSSIAEPPFPHSASAHY